MQSDRGLQHNISPADSKDRRGPRVLTFRNAAILLFVILFAVIMASASIYMRRAETEKTANFFGEKVIYAISVGPLVSMEQRSPSAANSEGGAATEQPVNPPVMLSGSPGLGLFRRALIDDRHYQWSTAKPISIESSSIPEGRYFLISFSDDPQFRPPGNVRPEVEPTRVMVEAKEGWVGVPGSGQMVMLTERARPAVENFLKTRRDIRPAPSK